MPLVKNGKIAGDVFVHVADDAELPGDGAILISAARFLEDPEALSRRPGKTGVIWPNNRDVDDLVPYLDRLAVVALVFPTFRDGRAYSQARLLRERYGYRRRIARHRPGAARPVRVHAARRLRCLRGEEGKRRRSVRQYRQALFGVLPADRRWPHHRAASADAAAPFGECQPVNALCASARRRTDAAAICRRPKSSTARLRDASPAEVIAAALQAVGREHLALVSSFGTESAALLKVMADVDPAIPVIFLDTGWLFEETLAYRDTLIATLGLRDVRSIKPLEETLVARGSRSRIVVLRSRCLLPHPQGRAAGAGAGAVRAWINGRKRFQGGAARRQSRSSRQTAPG